MKTYKVSCEFYIKAKNKEKAEEIVIDDMSFNDFFEEHISIEESSLPQDETHWNEV
jgi:hypothetical protein